MIFSRLATRQVTEMLPLGVTKQERNDEANVLDLVLLPNLSFLYSFEQLNLEALYFQKAKSINQIWFEKNDTRKHPK